MALAPLVALARDLDDDPRALKRGFGWGFLAGMAFFLPLLAWLRNIDDGDFAWIAVPLLAAIQALTVAAFVGGLATWGPRRGRLVLAVALWVALEWLRGAFPFGGFPWGLLGYTQAGDGPLLPVARGVGVLGLSALLAVVAVSVEQAVHRATHPVARGPRRWGAVAAPLAVGVVVVGVGPWLTGPSPQPTGEELDVAAIQGFDVEDWTGRDLTRAEYIAAEHADLTEAVAQSSAGPPELTIWPENALDADVFAESTLRQELRRAETALGGAALISGVIEDGPEPGTTYNSLWAFEDAEPLDRYLKRHPVPFGEYIPLRPLFAWFPALERVGDQMIAGEEPGVLATAGTRIGGVICFDVIWPRYLHEQVHDGAELLVVGTNNSSFGWSAASDQHIAFSQLRAVETGRWVVHAALSGRSAIVSPDGQVHQRTGLYEQAVVRDEVALVSGETWATRVGEAPGLLAVAVVLAMGAIRLAPRLRGRPVG